MNRTLFLIVLIGAGLAGCGKQTQTDTTKSNTKTNPPAESGNPLTAPLDYLGAVGKAQKTAIKVTDLASVNRAIQAFNAGEDRNPKDLNELVSKNYLPRLPELPASMQLQYNPQSGQVRIIQKQK